MKRLALTIPLLFAFGCGSSAEPTGQPDTEPPAQTSPGGETDSPVENPTDKPTDEPTDQPTDEPTEDPADALRLTAFHEEVFVAEGCTSGYCHGNFGLGSPDAVVSAFVDVEAPEPTCGRTHYVVPGDPEASILWVRVRPITAEDEECGVAKMPSNSETGLDEQTAQVIYDWIADGAHL